MNYRIEDIVRNDLCVGCGSVCVSGIPRFLYAVE